MGAGLLPPSATNNTGTTLSDIVGDFIELNSTIRMERLEQLTFDDQQMDDSFEEFTRSAATAWQRINTNSEQLQRIIDGS